MCGEGIWAQGWGGRWVWGGWAGMGLRPGEAGRGRFGTGCQGGRWGRCSPGREGRPGKFPGLALRWEGRAGSEPAVPSLNAPSQLRCGCRTGRREDRGSLHTEAAFSRARGCRRAGHRDPPGAGRCVSGVVQPLPRPGTRRARAAEAGLGPADKVGNPRGALRVSGGRERGPTRPGGRWSRGLTGRGEQGPVPRLSGPAAPQPWHRGVPPPH